MKDNLTQLLKACDERRQPEFPGTDEFKKSFFEAAAKETAAVPKRKLVLWFAGTVTAAAAAIFMTFSFLSSLNVPREKGSRGFASEAQRLMRKLKSVFPENNVGLCLINGELETFEDDQESKRDILLDYSLQRQSDGKVLKLSLAASNNNSSELNSGDARGSVWVYQPDSKLLNVDTDLALKLDAQTTVKITESKLLKMNQKQLVSEFEYQGQKYRLFQTASRI
jgi:hypothetical protein